MEHTVNLLRSLLVTSAGLDVAPAMVPQRGILNGFGVDSASGMRFLIRVEQEFGFIFRDDELSLTLVDDLEQLAAYIQTRCDGG